MLKAYKAYSFKEKASLKNVDKSWYQSSHYLEKVLTNNDSIISLEIVRQIIESASNNTPTRKFVITGVANFLSYFDINGYEKIIDKYKADNRPQTNTSTYFDTMNDDTKLLGMLDTLNQTSQKESKLKIALKENEKLKTENELLKTKLKMYEAIQESKGQK